MLPPPRPPTPIGPATNGTTITGPLATTATAPNASGFAVIGRRTGSPARTAISDGSFTIVPARHPRVIIAGERERGQEPRISVAAAVPA